MIRLIFISDTHGKHSQLTNDLLTLNDGVTTIILHAGDVSDMGREHQIKSFLEWYAALPFKHKIFIAGNHDWGFEKMHDIPWTYKDKGVIYLMDSMVSVEGLTIYGSPWQPRFYDWAFNVDRNRLDEKWKMIPEGMDIIMTHGPVHGILDYTPTYMSVGCEILRDKIIELQPKIYASGHIHFARGIKPFGDTLFINASSLDEEYQYRNKPIVVELDEDKNITEYYSLDEYYKL
jgi:Icc-related predicted phosphoesterase